MGNSKPWQLLALIADEGGVSRKHILGPARHKTVVLYRRIAMWCLRQRGFSLPEIGNILNRHHTTVLGGLRWVERHIASDEDFKQLVAMIDGKAEQIWAGQGQA